MIKPTLIAGHVFGVCIFVFILLQAVPRDYMRDLLYHDQIVAEYRDIYCLCTQRFGDDVCLSGLSAEDYAYYVEYGRDYDCTDHDYGMRALNEIVRRGL